MLFSTFSVGGGAAHQALTHFCWLPVPLSFTEINRKSGPGHLVLENGPVLIKPYSEISQKSGPGHLRPESGTVLIKP